MSTITTAECEELAISLVEHGTATAPDGRTLRLTKSDDTAGMFTPTFVVDRRTPGAGAWERAFLSLVTDIQTYGHEVWTVEVIDGTDAFGRPVIRDFESTVTHGADEPGAGAVEFVTELVRQVLSR